MWQKAFQNIDVESFQSTFWDCVENEQIGMMQYIAGKPSHIDKFDQVEWSCLHTIAYAVHPRLISDSVTRKQLNTFEQLFKRHSNDLMQFSSGGNLPIHLACQMNNSLILKIIIDVAKEKLSKQQLEQMLTEPKRDKYWNLTPLMIAIQNNCIDCVKVLCTYECVIVSLLSYKARYPNYNELEFACYYNNTDILKILFDLCDPTEYLSHLIKIAQNGLSNGCLDSKCIEFLNTLTNNPKVKRKQSGKQINFTAKNENDTTELPPICCSNHVLPRADYFVTKKCDICQETRTGCRTCAECDVFPINFCENCVTATSIWSMIVHSSEKTKDFVKHRLHLINSDTVDRVE